MASLGDKHLLSELLGRPRREGPKFEIRLRNLAYQIKIKKAGNVASPVAGHLSSVRPKISLNSFLKSQLGN